MEATAKDWLDSLSAGTCELSALLKGVSDLLRRSPDEGWELLSVVDQYYRRGKISATVFATLKAHLQGLLVGSDRPEVSVPMPRSRIAASTPPVAAATLPVPEEPHTPATTVVRALVPGNAQPVAAGSAAIATGSVLRNRYRIQGILGHGGTGTVFEAADLYRLDAENGHEKVAIKILHPNVVRRSPLFAELRREFQRLQLLSHPNIVRVHEFDRDGETAFFTMEHLSGVLLSRVIAVRESAPLARDHARALLRDITGAIAYAHSRGVVHGDVSPGNIFVCNDGELRVLDFGGNGVATPGFASCQILDGEAPDARDDVYGLACIAYVLLAGVHPFQEQTASQARAAKLRPKRPRGLNADQWRALRAGLSFDRSSRPAEVAKWANLLNPKPPSHGLPTLPTLLSAAAAGKAVNRWPAVAVLTLVVIGGGWWLATHVDSFRFESAGTLPHDRMPSATITATEPPVSAIPALQPEVRPPAQPRSTVSMPAEPVPSATTLQPADIGQGRLADDRRIAAVPTTPFPAPATGSGSGAPTNPGSRARLELSTDNVEVSPADGLVRVMVRRTRSLRGEVSFKWWTESGTAKPGRDFSPVASHLEQIEDGKSAVNLLIPILADPQHRQARSFYVVIDEASPTAAVGPRTLAMVTIADPE